MNYLIYISKAKQSEARRGPWSRADRLPRICEALRNLNIPYIWTLGPSSSFTCQKGRHSSITMLQEVISSNTLYLQACMKSVGHVWLSTLLLWTIVYNGETSVDVRSVFSRAAGKLHCHFNPSKKEGGQVDRKKIMKLLAWEENKNRNQDLLFPTGIMMKGTSITTDLNNILWSYVASCIVVDLMHISFANAPFVIDTKGLMKFKLVDFHQRSVILTTNDRRSFSCLDSMAVA